MPSVLVQGAKWAHSVTARRQKNSGKNVKKRNGWQLVKKDSSIGLRWQDGEKKNPTLTEKRVQQKKKQKKLNQNSSFCYDPCELRTELSRICNADKYFHSVFTDRAIIKIHFPNCWCVFKPRICTLLNSLLKPYLFMGTS